MKEIIDQTNEKMKKTIEVMGKKFFNIRAGRANAAILNPIKVNYYGIETPLIQLATISIPESRVLTIKPFDKSCLSNIEKAIFEADLGLTPNNNGDMIIINFPSLTEERRKEYVKQVKGIAEETRISLRNLRQDGNNNIKELKLPEDQEKGYIEEIQELINKYNKKIDEELKAKEEELIHI